MGSATSWRCVATPQGASEFRAIEGGLSHANELVELIREHHPEVGIGVAAYPEKHVEAPDPETDLAYLKQKIDAGADAAFSQLFFNNHSFFRFRDRYEQAGCRVPLVPDHANHRVFPDSTHYGDVRGRISGGTGKQTRSRAARRTGAAGDRRGTCNEPVPGTA